MEYTNEQVKQKLDLALKLLKDKHNLDISEEKLLSNHAVLSSDENLETLAFLMSVAESEKGEKGEKETGETTTITVEVLKKTADHLNSVYEGSGVPIGEQIDRMSFNFHPYDIDLAVQLICEDILAHTVNFNDVQFRFVIYLVLSMIKKSLKSEEPDGLRRLVDEVAALARGKCAEAPVDSESK